MAHEAWVVTWAPSDTATMSPALPSLAMAQWVSTWVPGQIVTPPAEPKTQNEMPGFDHVVKFLMIGMPIIGVAIIACSIWCCVACRRSRRRERTRLQEAGLTVPMK
jgi:heme/copper-type cytochrome/quinol oxidase subunit 2